MEPGRTPIIEMPWTRGLEEAGGGGGGPLESDARLGESFPERDEADDG